MQEKSLNNIFSKHGRAKRRTCLGICLMVICFLVLPPVAEATGTADQKPKVLVVYTTESGEITEKIRMLDLLLGHFTADARYVSDAELSATDMENVTHLVYGGTFAAPLPQAARQLLSTYQGKMLAIGANVEQLGSRYSFLSANQPVDISAISLSKTASPMPLEQNYVIRHIQAESGDTLLWGWSGPYAHPLLIQRQDAYYFATDNLFQPFHAFLGEALHSFFQQPHHAGHYAYIRLEDVHPYSDAALLKETGDFLADRNIPFMIALIPVYTNPQTLQLHHLKENRELVEVLRHLQSRGASILLHGYTHQYRQSETGEGFEFWDVKNNSPVSGPPETLVRTKNLYDFATTEAYERYLEQNRAYEERYIRTRVERGIQELTELGLYPVGFEAPHYTISQRGYQIVSEYFRFVLGQAQLGDRDWEIMNSPPYLSTPSFLHGMMLLPETIGYYDPTSLTPLADMAEKMKNIEFVRDGVFGMFYHPYLGIDHLQELISYMETVPGLSWIDLRQMYGEEEWKTLVSQGVIPASSSLVTDLENPNLPPVLPVKHGEAMQKILWGVAALVTVMVLLFLLYTLRNRMNLRKQLFQEQDYHG
ncbi:polysaccharide deacetylase family protein [Brevibacillus composti]|uniref:Polysaccharide deacetylase family protein n=1 Tax=Brevibacillus composti TaxID=2796470 RepID=A0A7T5EJF0_9BACL|nr:polysaccharide deacetylase family protein [Brevibacillus composti]QQE73731.1 polysaccharide deacetylase family protein [Brevibacillus composti]QUO40814.1 polysaccharide deacetylase family protein [Brevibacillus composti]